MKVLCFWLSYFYWFDSHIKYYIFLNTSLAFSTGLQTDCSCLRTLLRKTLCQIHIQCLSKSARTCDQDYFICVIPPFPDKICLVNIKYMLGSYFLKILIPESSLVLIHMTSPLSGMNCFLVISIYNTTFFTI